MEHSGERQRDQRWQLRIDHAPPGTHLAVTGITATTGFGSDYRYLDATVAVQS
jgi:hypothetical protein